jgi:hypothetical protein
VLFEVGSHSLEGFLFIGFSDIWPGHMKGEVSQTAFGRICP